MLDYICILALRWVVVRASTNTDPEDYTQNTNQASANSQRSIAQVITLVAELIDAYGIHH